MPSLRRFFHQVFVLATEELRDLIFRRRAALSLILYLGVITLVVMSLAYIEEKLWPSMSIFQQDSPERGLILTQFEKYGLRDELELILKIGSLPRPVVIMQLFSLLWFPTLVALVSCDMVSIDLYRGTLRFLLGRTGRAAYYFSKMLAHFALYFLLQVLTLLVLFVTCALKTETFDKPAYVASLLAYFGVFLVFLWFVVATTQFISCWSVRPINAVIRLHLLWVVFLGLLFIYPWASPLNAQAVVGLVAAPFEGAGWRSVSYLACWSALFSLAGLLLFQRRAL